MPRKGGGGGREPNRDLNRTLSDDIQDNSLSYDAVPFDLDSDEYDGEDDHVERSMVNSRRWSILEKLERRSASR